MEKPYGGDGHLVCLPFGFRAAYGIEEQEDGVVRHLGVSVDGEDRWPNPVAVEALLAAFGMPSLAHSLFIKTFPLEGRDRRNMVHVLARHG